MTAATSSQWRRRMVNSYEAKKGIMYLKCKNCVIHTWALQRWASYNEALYKCLYLYLHKTIQRALNRRFLMMIIIIRPIFIPLLLLLLLCSSNFCQYKVSAYVYCRVSIRSDVPLVRALYRRRRHDNCVYDVTLVLCNIMRRQYVSPNSPVSWYIGLGY